MSKMREWFSQMFGGKSSHQAAEAANQAPSQATTNQEANPAVTQPESSEVHQ